MLQLKVRQHKGSTQGNHPISKQKLSSSEQDMKPQPLAFMAGALITIPPSRLQTGIAICINQQFETINRQFLIQYIGLSWGN